MEKKKIKSGLWVDYVPQEVYDNLSIGEKNILLEFRRFNYRRRRKEEVIIRLEKEIEKLTKSLDKFKKDIKPIVSEEKELFDNIFYLGSKITPKTNYYYVDETSKSLRGKILPTKSKSFPKTTNKGEPLKHRLDLYVKIKLGVYSKTIFIGNQDKLRKILTDFYGMDFTSTSKSGLIQKMSELIEPYFKFKIHTDLRNFISDKTPFNKVILPWIFENKELHKKYC